LAFKENKSGVTGVIGLGYKAVFWESLIASGGLSYIPINFEIVNPNSDAYGYDGGLDGAALPPVLLELNLGYRF
jgi:hypothetical protein